MSALRVYVERGRKRYFAGAVDWPGLDRGGREEDAALDALAAAAPRYRQALGRAVAGLEVPPDRDALRIAERVDGNASTDFGIPAIGPASDGEPVDGVARRRLTRILRGAWQAFDAAAEGAAGHELRKGPRGGGRDVEAIVRHVLGGEQSYLNQIAGRHASEVGESPAAEMERIRAAVLEAWNALADGKPRPVGPRRRSPLWTPRYFVRRSAWHALDHAWEIEDRLIRS